MSSKKAVWKKAIGGLLTAAMVMGSAFSGVYAQEKLDIKWLPKGDHASEIKEGMVRVSRLQKGKDEGHLWEHYFTDLSGNIVIPMEKDWKYSSFSDGLMLVTKYTPSEGMKYGYMDKKGKIVLQLPKKYQNQGSFHEGLAMVEEPGYKWGFIDKTGKVVIPVKYGNTGRSTTWFSDGLTRVYENDKKEKEIVIDKSGKKVFDVPKDCYISDYANGFASISKRSTDDSKVGLIDKKGKIIISIKYDGLSGVEYSYESVGMGKGFFLEGLQGVKVGKKYGFIDQKDKMVIAPAYDGASNFSEGIAIVTVGEYEYVGNGYEFHGKYGAIDKNGKVIIPIEYDSLGGFSEGLTSFTKGEIRGYLDKNGKAIVSSESMYFGNFVDGYAIVNKSTNDLNENQSGILKHPIKKK